MAISTHDDEVTTEFNTLVNMTARELEAWLDTDESREVGQKASERSESTGHQSGRAIVSLLRKKKTERDAADVREMHRVVGYIKRHLAQRPNHATEHTRWAYSLKNWGHDPAKD